MDYCKMDKDFVGRQALEEKMKNGPPKKVIEQKSNMYLQYEYKMYKHIFSVYDYFHHRH